MHIYRLISEHTVEENILRKSNQKRHLDQLAIQSAGFTTAALGGAVAAADGAGGAGDGVAAGAGAIRDILGIAAPEKEAVSGGSAEVLKAMAQAEDADDAAAASVAEREAAEANTLNADDFEEGGGGGGSGGGVAAGVSQPGAAKPTAEEARAALRPIERYAVRVRAPPCRAVRSESRAVPRADA